MRFSQFAGVAIVPTLSRLVLALAFITAGFNKCFTEAQFSAEKAAELQKLDVVVTPIEEAVGDEAQTGAVQISFRQSEEPILQEPGEAEPAGEITELPGPDTAADEPEPAWSKAVPELPEGPCYAASMHGLTLLFHNAGWSYPDKLALIASVVELVSGVLLLLGFLSRIWGLGLAIGMGMAVYLVSVNLNQAFLTDPFAFAQDIPNHNALLRQLGMFVLAFGIFLTGPGPISLDRMFFGSRKGRRGGEPDLVDASAGEASRPI